MERSKRYIRHINKLLRPPKIVQTFLDDETTSGKLIIFFAILALIVVNSPLVGIYDSFWTTKFTVGFDAFNITQDLRHWVSEGLMSIFFLVVGLEIKRELVNGELRDPRKASLPIAAAIGGMIVPAVFYFAFNMDSEVVKGWGIPIATDIAFAVGVLALLGRRVPLALKLFLLTLAIVDDILAIFVIALFYAEIINYYFLAISAGIILATWIFRKHLTTHITIFIIIGVVLWLTTHKSGIHASIVGAVMGLLAPVAHNVRGYSVNKKLEEWFLPVSTFVVVPLFAFASAGVVLSTAVFDHPSTSSIMIGVIGGLVVGKLVGITGATWLMVKFGYAKLPEGVHMLQVAGVALVAGIGFTVSIFITELAFDDLALQDLAKISIFIASALAAILGISMLYFSSKTKTTD